MLQRDLSPDRFERVTTDGHTADPKAIAEVLGTDVEHRVSDCLTNRIEQDHRGIKQRYYPMLGFKTFASAKRYCQVFDRVRNFFRSRSRIGEFVSLSTSREQFVTGVQQLHEDFQAASSSTKGRESYATQKSPLIGKPDLTDSLLISHRLLVV
ncbi:DDE-type integrase/transposase/recombinase [Chroococcidiopsis sp.]|uniref:DDE-type integrase/transposase/recombinase n=1 Tax=Chroococcidiopsis sp. TaxID=3088168 RepID=UPI003F2B3E57